MASQATKQRLQKLLDKRHDSASALAHAAAERWTIENLGMLWPEDNWRDAAFCTEVSESDLMAEHSEWLDLARRLVARVQARRGKLTLREMEVEFKRRAE